MQLIHASLQKPCSRMCLVSSIKEEYKSSVIALGNKSPLWDPTGRIYILMRIDKLLSLFNSQMEKLGRGDIYHSLTGIFLVYPSMLFMAIEMPTESILNFGQFLVKHLGTEFSYCSEPILICEAHNVARMYENIFSVQLNIPGPMKMDLERMRAEWLTSFRNVMKQVYRMGKAVTTKQFGAEKREVLPGNQLTATGGGGGAGVNLNRYSSSKDDADEENATKRNASKAPSITSHRPQLKTGHIPSHEDNYYPKSKTNQIPSRDDDHYPKLMTNQIPSGYDDPHPKLKSNYNININKNNSHLQLKTNHIPSHDDNPRPNSKTNQILSNDDDPHPESKINHIPSNDDDPHPKSKTNHIPSNDDDPHPKSKTNHIPSNDDDQHPKSKTNHNLNINKNNHPEIKTSHILDSENDHHHCQIKASYDIILGDNNLQWMTTDNISFNAAKTTTEAMLENRLEAEFRKVARNFLASVSMNKTRNATSTQEHAGENRSRHTNRNCQSLPIATQSESDLLAIHARRITLLIGDPSLELIPTQRDLVLILNCDKFQPLWKSVKLHSQSINLLSLDSGWPLDPDAKKYPLHKFKKVE